MTDMPIRLAELRTVHINKLQKIDSVEKLARYNLIERNHGLYWCNGILFYYRESTNEEVTSDLFRGHWYLDLFRYAECKEYPESIRNGNTFSGVLDYSGFDWFEQLTQLVKENKTVLTRYD